MFLYLYKYRNNAVSDYALNHFFLKMGDSNIMQHMQFLNSYSALIVAKLKVLVLAYINKQYCHMQNLGATHHPSISASGWGISIHR